MNLFAILTLSHKASTGKTIVLMMALTGNMIASAVLTGAFIVTLNGFIVTMMVIICFTNAFIPAFKGFIVLMMAIICVTIACMLPCALIIFMIGLLHQVKA